MLWRRYQHFWSNYGWKINKNNRSPAKVLFVYIQLNTFCEKQGLLLFGILFQEWNHTTNRALLHLTGKVCKHRQLRWETNTIFLEVRSSEVKLKTNANTWMSVPKFLIPPSLTKIYFWSNIVAKEISIFWNALYKLEVCSAQKCKDLNFTWVCY